jgi:predicted nucleic acid-binding Zn ribbon protein
VTRYRRQPRPLSGALDRLQGEWVPATLLARIQQCWAAVAGAEIAAVSRPVSERGGVLTVVCDESAWAQELQLLSRDIVAALNRELGDSKIRTIRCVTGGS